MCGRDIRIYGKPSKVDSAHILLPGIYWKTKLLYDKAKTDSPYRNEIQNTHYIFDR